MPAPEAGSSSRLPGLRREARDADIRRILGVARSLVGLDVAWVSRFEGDAQVFTHVSSRAPGLGPVEGSSGDLAGSYCLRVLDGRLPAVIPDVAAEPAARDLPVTAQLQIAAYVGVPLQAGDGSVRGMLCCTDPEALPEPGTLQLAFLQMLAGVVATLVEGDAASDAQDDAELEQRRRQVLDLVEGSGRTHLLQPIVDVRTGSAVGAEALTRFDAGPQGPDHWFAEAEALGLRLPLEVAAAAAALTSLPGRTGYVSINLSPDIVVAGALDTVLAQVDPARVVVEITEHAPVADYPALAAALAPYRARGLRLAIDDAGAGYASFRHILQLQPDYIKVDISLVRDIHLDPVRQALTASLLAFGRTAGAQLIAEGVETQDELDTLARLGVTLMQGFLLGRPTAAPPPGPFPGPSRHVRIDAGADLSSLLAEAVRYGDDLTALARTLLDAVLRVTGLEVSGLMLLREGDMLEHTFVQHAGDLQLPEGVRLPWEQSLCSCMQAKQLVWTNDARRDLAERPLAAQHQVATYLSVPVRDLDGDLVGTVCAGSTRPLFISDAAVAQVQLVAHVLSAALARTAAPR